MLRLSAEDSLGVVSHWGSKLIGKYIFNRISPSYFPQSLQTALCVRKLHITPLLFDYSDSVSDPDFAPIVEIFHGIATAKDQSNSMDMSPELTEVHHFGPTISRRG